MIKKIAHKKKPIAKQIHTVFQVSYPVEAALLKAKDFPPLKRTVENFMETPNDFFGFYYENELAAVTEVKWNTASVHIQSLVVDPAYFRKGIAGKLITFILKNYKVALFTVETGAANDPAIQLYLKFGFKLIEEFDTVYDIRKVRFKYVVKEKIV